MENSKLSKPIKLTLAIGAFLIGVCLIVLAFFVKKHLSNWGMLGIMIPACILIFISINMVYLLFQRNNARHKLSTREISLIGIQSALTVILYYIASYIPPVPFFPSWLSLGNISELPALITTFAYGPYAGSIVILIRFIIKLPGTFTAGVGELADLILGLVLVIVSGMIYERKHTLKGAIIGLAISMGACTIIACVLNWSVLIPAYIYFAGFTKEALAGMLSYMGNVTPQNFMLYYIFIGVLPFNIMRYVIVFVLTLFLYKRTHMLLKKLANAKKEDDDIEENEDLA